MAILLQKPCECRITGVNHHTLFVLIFWLSMLKFSQDQRSVPEAWSGCTKTVDNKLHGPMGIFKAYPSGCQRACASWISTIGMELFFQRVIGHLVHGHPCDLSKMASSLYSKRFVPQSSSLHSKYLRGQLHTVDAGYRTMKHHHSLLWTIEG